MNTRHWIYGLGAAFIGGAATAATGMVVAPETFNLGDLVLLGKMTLVSGILNAAFYLKQSPLPPETDIPLKINLPLLLFLLASAGCASTTPQKLAQDALPYLPTATRIAAGIVLQVAINDPAERQEISAYMYSVAHGVRSLEGGSPNVDLMRKTISLSAPSAGKWADLATSLSSVYAGVYPSVKGDPKLALDVLEAIAQGCDEAAASVLKLE